jgi:beta-lactamase regulating signal transducer with metallopeptidase domain
MTTLAEAALIVGGSIELGILVKTTVALLLGLAAARAARRTRAAVRHLLLASTFAALIAVPAALVAVPAVAIPVTIAGPPVAAGPIVATTTAAGRALPAPGVSDVEAGPAWSLPSWRTVLRAAWMTGAALVLLPLASGLWRLGRIRRHGLPWLERRALVHDLAAEAGIGRRVEIHLHEDVAAPLTFGLRRPVIVVPADARAWPEADLRRALVHELEHVRRGDWPLQLAARAACAAYWFNPLAWMAYRQLCLEAERACDDAVLRSAEETEYAEQLVELARRLSIAQPPPMLAMASRGDLSTRISAILDTTQRRGRIGPLAALATVAAALALVLAVAPLRAVALAEAREGGADAEESTDQRPRRVRALDRALLEAAEHGDASEVASLIAAGANVNASIDGDGSPLIAAARKGRIAIVRQLLDQGADPNLGVGGDGSPLIMAAREGHDAIVALLLDRGANIDQVVPGDENPLIQASAEGHLRVVRLLVGRGADVNARVWVDSPYGRQRGGEWRTPLSMARQGGHDAVVAYLMSSGARE